MARRSELKGIANSLNGSFISRNNDFDGYWSIGLLKLFAIERGFTSVGVSLPLQQPDTNFSLINDIAQRYTVILADLLRKQHLPNSWVSNVSITVDFFAIVAGSQLSTYPASGTPFKCLCQIIDDNGWLYTSISYGRCKPHSAVRELRSSRRMTR
ncbi:hypothetical protein [Cedecea colo]|uniref:Uncharacterized protein n=1 Tax=Cedecea colo TaxID=2552946 RepID=A0ABX0VKJ2_9ENTR|nr:hypothetical protein [Cedecea colo]NIY47533.1 hypothetical protein [Cedecea colo]